jgi:hypothetical protein
MRPEMGRAHCWQRTPERTLVGVQCDFVVVPLLRGKGFDMPREAECLGSGSGLVDPPDPLTLIDGMDGVTEIEGVSLTEMDGMEGVTDIAGAFTAVEPWVVGLTEIEGVSETEIVGMGGMAGGLERAGGA